MPCPALPQSGIRDPKGPEAKWGTILGAVDGVKLSYGLKQNRKDLPQREKQQDRQTVITNSSYPGALEVVCQRL